MASFRRRTLVAVLGCLAWSCHSGVAAGQDPRPAAESWTLNGKQADRAAATAGSNFCQAHAAKHQACFTSGTELARATAAALRDGRVPDGWLALPPEADRPKLIAQLEKQAASGDAPVRPSPAADQSRRKRKKVKARASAGYDCNNAYGTFVYTGYSFTGSYTYSGYTGLNNWGNYTSPFHVDTSSFWAMPNYTSRWHDYWFGDGAYYGAGYACRYVENLGNASMTDGRSADNRFSSFATW